MKNWKVMMIIRSVLCIFSHAAKEEAFLDRETLLRFVKMKSTLSDPLINSCLSTKTVYNFEKHHWKSGKCIYFDFWRENSNVAFIAVHDFGAKIQILRWLHNLIFGAKIQMLRWFIIWFLARKFKCCILLHSLIFFTWKFK